MALTEARHKANEKWNAKAYDEIKVRVPKGQKSDIQTAAAVAGESTNTFIAKSIEDRMKRT